PLSLTKTREKIRVEAAEAYRHPLQTTATASCNSCTPAQLTITTGKAIVHPKHKCLGALDWTHVKIRVVWEDQHRYCDRKGDVSINVLGVCNPNTEFIYCSARWEGSAHDGRVLCDALGRPNGFGVPKGNYYLCDAGYANSEGSLTPL
ncbi:hypothetical protein LINPERHAP1_LOCUS5138, partial [Linum perenne]